MGFEKRKANIIFKASDCVQITNIFFQKTFYLKNECVVDLFKLKKTEMTGLDEFSVISKIDHPFFVCFLKHKCDDWCDDEKCPGNHWYGEVVLRTSEEDLEVLDSEEDTVTLLNNDKIYNGAVWVDE